MYLIYSIKHGGWYGKTGQFVSDLEQAKRVTRDQAVATCILHISQDQLGAVPVTEADIEEILP